MSARHRLFAYLLLLRSPIAGELDDIDAAYGWIKRNLIWLIAGCVFTLRLTVWPAFRMAIALKNCPQPIEVSRTFAHHFKSM